MTKWVQSIRQTTTYLGLAVIAVIWSGVFLLGEQEHRRAYDEAVRQGGNLTLVLEEYVQRIVLQCDNVLLALRRDYRAIQNISILSAGRRTRNSITI